MSVLPDEGRKRDSPAKQGSAEGAMSSQEGGNSQAKGLQPDGPLKIIAPPDAIVNSFGAMRQRV